MSLSAARAPPLTQQSPRMHLIVCACVCRLRIRQPCPRAGGAPSSAQSCPRRACTLHSTSPPSAARPGCPAGLRTAAGALSHAARSRSPSSCPVIRSQGAPAPRQPARTGMHMAQVGPQSAVCTTPLRRSHSPACMGATTSGPGELFGLDVKRQTWSVGTT